MFDQYYGFSGRPFQLTPDPNFYFESITHRKALSYLGYGMAQGEGFIVITGEIGAGKSTMVAHLMRKVDPEQMTVGQVVTSNLDGSELVHLVAQSFGLDVAGQDKASALGAIETFLHEEARDGRRCLLVVDEAQNLSFEALEELRMMSNFQLGSHPLLQQLLLGQPEFKQTLAQHDRLEQLRQRVIAAHHLTAMEVQEVAPYIEHRLSLVNWKGYPSFDPKIFPKIHEASGGIPRRVNQIATRLLLMGAVEQRSQIDCAMLDQVVEEMARDSRSEEAQERKPAFSRPAIDLSSTSAPPRAPASRPAPAPTPTPAQRDSSSPPRPNDDEMSDLRAAIATLSRAIEGSPRTDGDLAKRVEALETRLEEQEQSVRYLLQLLIEWLDRDGRQKAA
ncbi:MAG: general secretion pathway protein [Citromicrobium sp.]|nr:general secretion pathway protein [Citromicrobium sp.]MAO96977.1 general secretion pathway protein [Citromicrobium sp.]MBT47725.1 general secretion pathway protein [Citromicrobium sp.]|tara:strand:- start:3024 stop:4196 length:1173 start_codon:yes stop_codon:yes gene_type:complete